MKHKIIPIMAAVVWGLCFFASPAQAKYGGGTGEPNDPYLIYDENQMNEIGINYLDWDKHFKLMADIDLSEFTGTSFNIIGEYVGYNDPNNRPFTGVFDGNGHTISNFTYISPSKSYLGLFGCVIGSNAEIKNLGLIAPDVDAGTGYYVGSLVGRLISGNITNCYLEADVSGHYEVGGLVGENGGIISNCYVTGSVTGGAGSSNLGGLCGWNFKGTISNSYATGQVSSHGWFWGSSRLGGLCGENDRGTISNCYATGSVSGSWYLGGLCGYNYYGTISNCYSESTVSGSELVGGLCGENVRGTISNCYSESTVSGGEWVGGLVGFNGGTITNCYSTTSVSGSGEWSYVGGLVGGNGGTITNCYSEGSVSGGGDVGGLAGHNVGTISNCYSEGDVSGGEYVGGLVGWNWGTINNCYSTGSVSGNNDVGGLVGFNMVMVSTSFWDIQTSGQTTSSGGTGKTTAEMQMESTFTDAGWDFNTPVWTIDEGVDYPRLWWELVPVLHAEPEVTLGTSNRISWEPVVGDVEYYAECGEDANFTSIIYNSGWIVETSYEFTGLELGQRYWYSVKARNAAGVETGWSNVESSLQGTLADVVDAIETMLDPESLKNENMKNALLNKIDAVLEMIDDGLYEDALSKLEHDILAKMNGCGETGEPDKNDWIITCEEQSEIYPLVIETIEYVRRLMGE